MLVFILAVIDTGENGLAVEGGAAGDPRDFLGQRRYLLLNGVAVLLGIGAVAGLNGQGADPLEHGGDFIHGPFGGLGEGNGVIGIAVALI